MSIRIPLGRLRTLFTIGAALVVCLGANAQNPGGGGQGRGQRGGFGRQMTIASVPVDVLASGLKLTDLQKAKLTALHDQYVKDMTALRPQPGSPPDQDARQKMQDLNTEVTSKMTDVLTADQQKELPDFLKSLGSYRTVGIPLEVLPALKLTSDQKTKIVTIAEEGQKAMQAKFQELQQQQQNGGNQDRQAMFQAFQTMQKENHDKAVAVLTASQKKTLEEYLTAHPQPTFGPGGRGGGRRGGGAGAGGNGPV